MILRIGGIGSARRIDRPTTSGSSKVYNWSRSFILSQLAKLMALAIRFQGLLDDGVVINQAELARLANVTWGG